MAQHYAGDDTNVKILLAGVLAAYDGMSVEEFEAQSAEFLRTTQHPTLGRDYLRCAAPMVELLDYLSANGFTTTSPPVVVATSCGRSARRCTTSRENA